MSTSAAQEALAAITGLPATVGRVMRDVRKDLHKQARERWGCIYDMYGHTACCDCKFGANPGS